MRQVVIAMGAVLLWALPLLSQTSPLTVTPTLVSVQLGQPLYCAAAWNKPNIQVYCYTSSTGHTWDVLAFNSIFSVTNTVSVPYVMTCPPAVACTNASIMWLFSADAKTAGTVDWQVSWDGTGLGKGTFQ